MTRRPPPRDRTAVTFSHRAPGPDPRAEAVARGAWWALAVMALARAVSAVWPTLHAWGIDFARFAPPLPAWALWAVMVVPLVPALGRPLHDRVMRAASALARHRGLAPTLVAAATLGLLLALPDRTGFVGDFLLRVGVLAQPEGFDRMFPQAMPLDRVLHWWLPRALGALTRLDAGLFARSTGLLEGALVAVLAVRFARALPLGRPARLTAAALTLFGGHLALYTGYGKPTIEVALLTLAIGVFGSALVRDGRGLVAYGLTVALAPLLHRAAFAVLPGAIVGWWWWLRLHGGPGGWRRPAFLVSVGMPLAAVAWLTPQVIGLVVGFDARVNFASPEVARQGGVLAAAIAPLRLLDLVNLLLLHAPLVPVALLAVAHRPRASFARPEGAFLLALVAGYLPVVLFTQVTQGMFRDWDAFSGAGAATALLVAWCVARLVDEAPRWAWLALPLSLAAAVPTVHVLLCHQDLDRGLARARALLDEPPRRSEAHRLATLDFLGIRSLRAWRWADAADAYRRLAQDAPHPRALVLWGTAAAIAGEDASAQRAFEALTERDPAQPMGWLGLWATSTWLGDSTRAARAREVVRRWAPDGPEIAAVETHLAHYPALAERLRRDTPRQR